jgi:hypothetical protein
MVEIEEAEVYTYCDYFGIPINNRTINNFRYGKCPRHMSSDLEFQNPRGLLVGTASFL